LYSKKALETVSVGNEFFDNDFFSYLEDIDLDYRLLFRGFESRYVPDAIAKHAGGGSGGRKSFLIRFKAHTNRYLVWIKNEERSGLMKDFFPIALQECLQLVRTLFTSPLLLLSWFYFPTKAIRVAKKGRSVYADGKEYGRLDDFKLKGRLFRKIA
ncbi:MAG: glycosyltransferase family 2 protein, partial [bacterium]